MENYTKGETRKFYEPLPLTREGAIEMKVTSGSKIRNLIGYASSSMSDNSVRCMTWNGTGNATNKTISCSEIIKRKIKGLHQITQIGYMRVEELWQPSIEGLDTLKVNTNVPTISILLSKDPLDSNNPSYQAPGAVDVMWAGTTRSSKNKHRLHFQKKKKDIKGVKDALSRPQKRPKGDRQNNKKFSKKKDQENNSTKEKE